MTIVYIPGEDNMVADALSCVPDGAFPGETLDNMSTTPSIATNHRGINMTLSITMDPSVLRTIQDGYETDEFCKKLTSTAPSTQGVHTANGLWYIGDRLVILHCGTIREDLFRLAHNASGHFSADKSYVTLCDAYYWPNMRRNLEKAYIPSRQKL
jgi:hypothetical protein